MYADYGNSRVRFIIAGIAAITVFAAVAIFLSTHPEKYAAGFYTIRPLDWWGTDSSVTLVLWNPMLTATSVTVTGDLNCQVRLPPLSFTNTLCTTKPANHGEYRKIRMCIHFGKKRECGTLTLVFD